MSSNDSRATMIRHLRNELEEVKKSCEKYEELNATMTILENNLKAIKEEKDTENEESQLKCYELSERIREADRVLADLKEEYKEGERAASEAKVQYERINSDLIYTEDKEKALEQRLHHLSTFLDELNNNQASMKEGIDVIKREVAEIKSNLASIEKEQISFEEKNSKLNLTRRNHLTTLSELETAEKRLLQLRNERDADREQLAVQLNKKAELLEDMNQEYNELDDQEQAIVNERSKIKEATDQVSEKRHQQEVEMTQVRAELNNLDSKIKNLDDEYRGEEQAFTRAADALNDQKERNEKLVREQEKFKACNFNLEELSSKVAAA
jgi:chromosome segregation ATPase